MSHSKQCRTDVASGLLIGVYAVAVTPRRALKILVNFSFTGVCLWWTFEGTNWPAMWASLAHANYWWLVPYGLILLFIHLLRTWRWGDLLSGIERVPFRPLNSAAGIGFMMLVILPFRLGEFARPFLIAERSSIRRSSAMTSVVLERIVDGVLVALVLRALLFAAPTDNIYAPRISWGANFMFMFFVSGLLFLVVARWQWVRTQRVLRSLFQWAPPRFVDKVISVVDGFVGALRQLPPPKYFARFLSLTALFWVFNAISLVVLSRAFSCDGVQNADCVPFQLTLFQASVAICVSVVGVMIPAAPGSAGTYQAFVVLALSLFFPQALVRSTGVAFANVAWIGGIIQQVALGLILLMFSHQSLSGLTHRMRDSSLAAPPPG